MMKRLSQVCKYWEFVCAQAVQDKIIYCWAELKFQLNQYDAYHSRLPLYDHLLEPESRCIACTTT
jgi:hypothetical protein